jgi:hypothetical protein
MVEHNRLVLSPLDGVLLHHLTALDKLDGGKLLTLDLIALLGLKIVVRLVRTAISRDPKLL